MGERAGHLAAGETSCQLAAATCQLLPCCGRGSPVRRRQRRHQRLMVRAWHSHAGGLWH